MCGIVGFVGRQGKKEEILDRMMDVIKHRGPDSEGKYTTSEVALGFRRLSIIDLESGSQPMFNEDGEIALIFNGEIYNSPELRERFQAKGHVFANRSDSETLIHGYEEYGEKLVHELRGMFGFAIWDNRKKRLFLARDFFGIKPVYYAMINKNLVFASEIKSILEFPGFKKEVNMEALEQYLSFQYSALPETFFKGLSYLLQRGTEHHAVFRPHVRAGIKRQPGSPGKKAGRGSGGFGAEAYAVGRGSGRVFIQRRGFQLYCGKIFRQKNVYRWIL